MQPTKDESTVKNPCNIKRFVYYKVHRLYNMITVRTQKNVAFMRLCSENLKT